MRHLNPVLLIVAIAAMLFPAVVSAQQPFLSSFGVRVGFPSNIPHDKLYQLELFGSHDFPWAWRHRNGWGISAQLDGSLGVLTSEGDVGFIGSVGPVGVVGKEGFPLELNFGVSGAILSRDTMGHKDYNGIVQFISHGGADLRLSKGFAVMYRFEHMSNAGFNGGHNPGVNLHLLGLRWYLDDSRW